MNYRNCEKCGGCYSTGKDYEDYWCCLSNSDVETKGLCEFCNPNSKTNNNKYARNTN